MNSDRFSQLMRAPEASNTVQQQLGPRSQAALASTSSSARGASRPSATMLWQDEAEERMDGIDWDTYTGPPATSPNCMVKAIHMSATEKPEYDYGHYITAFPNVLAFKGVPIINNGREGTGTITSDPADRTTLKLIAKVQLHPGFIRRAFAPRCDSNAFKAPNVGRLITKASAHYTLTAADIPPAPAQRSQPHAGVFLQGFLDGSATLPRMDEVTVSVPAFGQSFHNSQSPNWHGRQIWHYLSEAATMTSRKPAVTISYHNPTLGDYEQSLEGPYSRESRDFRRLEIKGTGTLPTLAECVGSERLVAGIRKYRHTKIHCLIDGQELPEWPVDMSPNRTMRESTKTVDFILHPDDSRGQLSLPSLYSVIGCFGGLGPGYPAVRLVLGTESRLLAQFCSEANDHLTRTRYFQALPRPREPI